MECVRRTARTSLVLEIPPFIGSILTCLAAPPLAMNTGQRWASPGDVTVAQHPAIVSQPPVPPEEAAAAGMQLPSRTEIAEVEAAEKFIAPVEAVPAKRRCTDV